MVAPQIIVKGGDIELVNDVGYTFVIPKEYGMIHDPAGTRLDKCSIFFGPIRDRGPEEEPLTDEQVQYFGNDYDARRASFDVPVGQWNHVTRIVEILYYRRGRYEDDWRHEFSEPVPLANLVEWYRLTLPGDCEMNWRGIVRP